MFLVDMASQGIGVRPIAAMIGPHHLNEVYFTDVFVRHQDVLGAVDEGWSIVAEVLGFERIGIARYARCEKLLAAAPHELGEAWSELPASLIERWVRAQVRTRQARLLAYRLLDRTAAGAPAIADAALYRIAVTTLDQEVAEVLMDIVGAAGLGTIDPDAVFHREVEDHWRYAQASTVASGTVEMNKQAVARKLVTR